MFRYALIRPERLDAAALDYLIAPLTRFLDRTAPGEYTIIVRRDRKRRSSEQNAYLWGVVYPCLLIALQNAGWEFTDAAQVHDFFKQTVAGESFVNRATGEAVTLPRSTAHMDTAEFAAYVEKLRDYALRFLDTDIPEPSLTSKNSKNSKNSAL